MFVMCRSDGSQWPAKQQNTKWMAKTVYSGSHYAGCSSNQYIFWDSVLACETNLEERCTQLSADSVDSLLFLYSAFDDMF